MKWKKINNMNDPYGNETWELKMGIWSLLVYEREYEKPNPWFWEITYRWDCKDYRKDFVIYDVTLNFKTKEQAQRKVVQQFKKVMRPVQKIFKETK